MKTQEMMILKEGKKPITQEQGEQMRLGVNHAMWVHLIVPIP